MTSDVILWTSVPGRELGRSDLIDDHSDCGLLGQKGSIEEVKEDTLPDQRRAVETVCVLLLTPQSMAR